MSKEGKGRERREGRRRQGKRERVGEWCIIYSLPWFKTRSGLQRTFKATCWEKKKKKKKSRTKTKPESHPYYPGRAGSSCPFSARAFQYLVGPPARAALRTRSLLGPQRPGQKASASRQEGL